MARQLTVELPGWQFTAADCPAIRPGALLPVILDGGAVTLGKTGGLGQLRLHAQGKPRLQTLAPGLFALAGVIKDVADYQVEDEALLEFEVDCGAPVRFTCLPDPAALPLNGLWASGVVTLTLALAESDLRPLGQPLTAIVKEVQQRCLRSLEENFGELRTLEELAPLPFEPDQVFLTLYLSDGLATEFANEPWN